MNVVGCHDICLFEPSLLATMEVEHDLEHMKRDGFSISMMLWEGLNFLNANDFPVCDERDQKVDSCCKCGEADLLPTSSNKSSLANYSDPTRGYPK